MVKEIELFRALHPDRPILAAIVRGELAEAFPAPFMDGAEPLAADLRREGDGWRLGFLKIIAGIAEVPLDALGQGVRHAGVLKCRPKALTMIGKGDQPRRQYQIWSDTGHDQFSIAANHKADHRHFQTIRQGNCCNSLAGRSVVACLWIR